MNILATAAIGASFLFAACTPTPKQLKEVIEKDPSIVFAAIEKDPEKFIEVVNAAAQNAQRKAQGKAQEEETKNRDAQFKNPLKPVIEEGRVIFGKKDAPITIVEYSDFECPYCSKGYQSIKEVRKQYGDKVRVVFKHLPLEFHPKALPAAKYFEAVAIQSPEKAEKFHDSIFENRAKLVSEGEKYLKSLAKSLGLDMKKLEKDAASEAVAQKIEKDTGEAKSFDITGTPGFIINGVALKGAYPASEFKTIIDKQMSMTK